MQYFKGDEIELKYAAAGTPIADLLSENKSAFFDDAYACFILGELIYDTDRAPLARAIPREIFRESFSTIFNSFLTAGSFESYITVFKNIFGDDVEITFGVPAPGKLTIDIVAAGFQLSDAIVRQIEDNLYVNYELVTDESDNIAFQTIKGFESQYELEQMLFEMVPDGIYTEISLTVGG